MKWLCPLVLFVIMAMETIIAERSEIKAFLEQVDDENEDLKILEEEDNTTRSHSVKKIQNFTKWLRWSQCVKGLKTRRKHCLRAHICGGALRVEVARCKDSHGQEQAPHKDKRKRNEEKRSRIQMLEKRQMQVVDGVRRRFRGFSSWSEWTKCSRRCTTVRQRRCLRRSICGKKIIKQSAYCYLDGSYCQHWIKSRMPRRKDPDIPAAAHTIEAPVLAIHPEDSRTVGTGPLTCGKLGRYRGTSAARLRYRMRDMVRIIGGRPSPPGKWPWQVAVLNRYKEAFCGGTLVSLRWVVTAAHCVRRRLYVRLGEHDLLLRTRGEVEMRVTEAVVHPRYDPDTVVNDVALLRLPAPARPELGHGIACLPHSRPPLPPHTTCVILGWGKKRPTDIHGTRFLHEAQVSTIQQGVCRRSYWQYAITDDMVCAGRGRRDSCAGDSGGPLLCRASDMKYYLQGITSFGDGCGKRGKYGIYTRTAGYVSWMREVMSKMYFD